MLYPVLHRMEDSGWITARWVELENGRKRKYYSIKQDGHQALKKKREQWTVISTVLGGALERTTCLTSKPPSQNGGGRCWLRVSTPAGVWMNWKVICGRKSARWSRPGASEAVAFEQAVAALGSPHSVCTEFNKIRGGHIWPVKIGWALWLAATLLVAGGLLRRLSGRQAGIQCWVRMS